MHTFQDSAKKILCTHFKTRLINLMHTFQDSSNKSYAHISRLARLINHLRFKMENFIFLYNLFEMKFQVLFCISQRFLENTYQLQ